MVINCLELGGAERLVVELSGRLRAHGCSTIIFSLGAGGTLEDAATNGGADVYSLGLGRADPRSAAVLTAALRNHPVDLLHLHLPRAGVLGRLAARRLRLRPVVYTEHNVEGGYGRLIRHLNQWTLGWCDHVVAVSDQVRSGIIARGVPPSRVTTIPNGVDVDSLTAAASRQSLRTLLDLPAGAPLLGTVANLHPRKGLEVLVAAVHRLRAQWPDVHAVVIGRDDGMGSELRSLAGRLGLDGAVHFLGPRLDAAALMASFDVFVLPSRVEGLPVALLEAMALRRPVVVTPVGGVPEVVRDGREGLHAPVGDPDAVARAVDRLLRAPEEAAALGAAAAARVRRDFSVDRMADAHARLYTRLWHEAAG